MASAAGGRSGRQRVQFAGKATADAYREQYPDYIAPSDDARTATVVFAAHTPATVIDEAEGEAYADHAERVNLPGESATLSDHEKRTLGRQFDTWSWQSYGLEAMRAKGALQAEGVTNWLNYYEPGEGAAGALDTLKRSKETAARTGAPAGIDGRDRDRDPDDPTVMRERGRQAARVGAERDRARDKIRENIRAIVAGEADKLVSDIEAYFGEEWVSQQIAEAREAEGIEPEPAPDPAPTPAPAPSPTPTRRQPRFAGSPILRAADRLPGPVRSVIIGLYVLARWKPDRRGGGAYV